jgi:hypothetical protein
MAIISLFPAGYRDQVGIVTDFAISQRKQAPTKRDFVGHCLKMRRLPVDSPRPPARNRQ